jgi:hypothetical protein
MSRRERYEEGNCACPIFLSRNALESIVNLDIISQYARYHPISKPLNLCTQQTIRPLARKQHLSSPAPRHAEKARAETAWRTLIPSRASNVVNVNLLLGAGGLILVRVAVVAVLVELEADALVAHLAVRVRLVDLCVFGEFAVGF